MPWVVQKSDKCPSYKPWAVINKQSGAKEGCHPTKDAATQQQKALYAKEPQMSSVVSDPASSSPRGDLVRAIFPGVELRDAVGDGMPTLVGHFAVFNQWAEIDSFFEGRFLEQLDSKSMADTFVEDRDSMRVLFQHGRDPQIGDKPIGPIQELEAQRKGAWYAVPMLDTAYNRELLPGLQAGLYGASFRFQVAEENWVKKPERSEHNPDGLPERTILKARVREFGPVTFPAYSGATAGVRSLTDQFSLPAELLNDPERLHDLIHRLTGRSDARSADGGVPDPDVKPGNGQASPQSLSAEQRARDRELRIRGIIRAS